MCYLSHTKLSFIFSWNSEKYQNFVLDSNQNVVNCEVVFLAITIPLIAREKKNLISSRELPKSSATD